VFPSRRKKTRRSLNKPSSVTSASQWCVFDSLPVAGQKKEPFGSWNYLSEKTIRPRGPKPRGVRYRSGTNCFILGAILCGWRRSVKSGQPLKMAASMLALGIFVSYSKPSFGRIRAHTTRIALTAACASSFHSATISFIEYLPACGNLAQEQIAQRDALCQFLR